MRCRQAPRGSLSIRGERLCGERRSMRFDLEHADFVKKRKRDEEPRSVRIAHKFCDRDGRRPLDATNLDGELSPLFSDEDAARLPAPDGEPPIREGDDPIEASCGERLPIHHLALVGETIKGASRKAHNPKAIFGEGDARGPSELIALSERMDTPIGLDAVDGITLFGDEAAIAQAESTIGKINLSVGP